MYSLLSSFDPKILKGEKLNMICFTANQIHFHFESLTRITIEGDFIIEENNQQLKYNVYPVKNDSGLFSLIETEIIDSYTDFERKNLHIKFSNKIILTLIEDDQFESYSINKGELKILV